VGHAWWPLLLPSTILAGTATGAVSAQTPTQQLPKGAPGVIPTPVSPAPTTIRTAIATGTTNTLGQRPTPVPGAPLVRPTVPASATLNRSLAPIPAGTIHSAGLASTPLPRALHPAPPSAPNPPSQHPLTIKDQGSPPAQGYYAPPQQDQYNNDVSQDQSDSSNDHTPAGAAGGAILGGGSALAYYQYEDNQPDGDDNGGEPDAQDLQAPGEGPVQLKDSGKETYEAYDPDTDMPVDEGGEETGGQITDQGQGGDVPEEEPEYPNEGDGYGQDDDVQGGNGVDDGN
jgi:hypothetical protein